ncbi:MAG: ThiF family adenylyltransferase [Candidatus Hermodarchaeota archaeon]
MRKTTDKQFVNSYLSQGKFSVINVPDKLLVAIRFPGSSSAFVASASAESRIIEFLNELVGQLKKFNYTALSNRLFLYLEEIRAGNVQCFENNILISSESQIQSLNFQDQLLDPKSNLILEKDLDLNKQHFLAEIQLDRGKQELGRFSRHSLLRGWKQENFTKSFVFQVGMNPLGVAVSLSLVGLGVGRIIISDSETIEPTDVKTHLAFTQRDIGRNKAEIVVNNMKEINSTLSIHSHSLELTQETLDLTIGFRFTPQAIICTSRNLQEVLLLNQYALERDIPLIYATTTPYGGEIGVIQRHGPCFRCFKDQSALVQDPELLNLPILTSNHLIMAGLVVDNLRILLNPLMEGEKTLSPLFYYDIRLPSRQHFITTEIKPHCQCQLYR